MNFLVVVPVIAPREETANARAMWDVDAPNLLLVDNTPDAAYEGGPWSYVRGDGNLGVAASWNKGIDADPDYLVIMSSYLVLDHGLARTVERLMEAANEWGCLTWQACHLWSFTRKTWETVGRFDEGYKIAYFEDVDYLRRLELAGCHNAQNPMPKIAVPGICPQARTLQLGLASPPMEENRARFLAKWGGPWQAEKFTTPYGDHTLSLKDWGP